MMKQPEKPLSAPQLFSTFPLDRLAIGIEIHSGEGHGMSRTTVESRDALSLVHTKGGAEESTIVEVVGSR